MRLDRCLLVTLACAGCATSGGVHSATPPKSADGQELSAVARLERGSEEQERRISELEARLALLEQEAHNWREAAVIKPAESIRIGGRKSEPPPPAELAQDEPRGPVPVVRLHEENAPAVLPAPPPGVTGRLPVVPLPEARAAQQARRSEEDGAAPEAMSDYRAALRLVSDRRWDEAASALTRFLDQRPEGALAAGATYWRGEVRYAQRRYEDALQDFAAVIARFPSSSREADALLKLGLCHLRLGDQALAQRYFRQVREQFPSSDAARIASREGPS